MSRRLAAIDYAAADLPADGGLGIASVICDPTLCVTIRAMRRRAFCNAIAVAASASAAQTPGWRNPFLKSLRDSFAEHWKDTREYTLAVLEAMPADGFDFKPNPAQRTFGEQLVHLASANVAYYASFGKLARPAPAKASDKESVRAYLTAAFDYVAQVLAQLTEDDMQRNDLKISARTPPHSAVDIFLRAYMHTAHHRGQAVVYLRVKGIQPPAWKFEPTV